ncbi:Putative aminopeptidase [Ignavibacterium album JCM 16511]|uniref:Putative aminopeptidase n=1 Tax=Ignavibacterium album (strain DSM 19864 / JCM 16511 / NBRC 101810 / Mat9-16) TaxID=945713 RepID=I0AFV2_IGNAJ|nr:M28 family peptidase [Ignavibacterium album]AFH47859.1 Putative aminopeptidase [Ignavibacterium album JCM 16511]
MKKHLQNLGVFFLFLFSFSSFAQNPTVQQIINSVKQDSLVYFVRELSGNVPTVVNGQTVTIVSRHKNNSANELAKDYIKQKLQSYGITTTIQNFSSSGNNVIGTQPGTQFPNQKLIICAHYDDMPSGTTAPGADDNASGTAAVIEAARILSQYSFPYTIVYALWDEEEQGLVGSNYYATQARNVNDSIVGVVNMDMIAYDSNNDGIVNVHNRAVANSVELYQKMVEVNSQYGINLTIVSYNPGSTYSDHASFWSKNYGAILLIEDDNDFNAYYHTTSDLVQYFNQPYYTKSAKLAIGTFATLALNLNLQISHTPIASMTQSQPVVTTAQITTGLEIGTGISAPRLYYRTSTGSGFSSFNEVVGTNSGGSNFSFTIPAIPLGSIVQYYIAAQDANSTIVKTLPAGGSGFNPPGNVPPPAFYQFYVAPVSVALYDEANNLNNWTSVSGWDTTKSKYVSPPTSFTDSPGSTYPQNVIATLTYNNAINLAGILGAELEFDTQWDIENNWDYGQVLVSTNNGSTWTPLAGNYTNPGTGSFQPPNEPLYDGTQTTWVHEKMNLSNFIGQTIKLRFLLRSDGSIQNDGWYVDNIKISTYNTVIPVELTSFTAVANGNNVELSWSTATETNNRGFEIQRSQSPKFTSEVIWEKIGFVNGKGTTTEPQSYLFTDKNLRAGKYSYRLKQIDFDGTFEYSNEIEVEIFTPDKFVLEQNYPNPFNPSTKISFVIPNSVRNLVTLIVYDVLGNEVATLLNEYKEAGRYEVEFNASELPSGIYYYKLSAGNFTDVKKMMVIK